MKARSNPIELWLGRLFISLFFLFFALSFSPSDSHTSYKADAFSVEQFSDIEHSAVLAGSVDVPNNKSFLLSSGLLNVKTQDKNLSIEIFQFQNQQKFKYQKLKFLHYKAKLLQIYAMVFRIASNEDEFMIS